MLALPLLPLTVEPCLPACPHRSIAKVNSDLLLNVVAKCGSYFLILFLLDPRGASGSTDPLPSGNSLLTSVMPVFPVFLLPPWLLLLCSFGSPSVCSHSLPWKPVLSPRLRTLCTGHYVLSLTRSYPVLNLRCLWWTNTSLPETLTHHGGVLGGRSQDLSCLRRAQRTK